MNTCLLVIASLFGLAYCATNGTLVSIRQCDTRSNCSLNEYCLNGLCECKPDFVREVDGECQRRNCFFNQSLCKVEVNRHCEVIPVVDFGQCVCNSNYIEDPDTGVCRAKCTPDIGGMCELVDGNHTVCNIYRCQCRANFRRDAQSGQCVPFECQVDSHCWSEAGYYRTCEKGQCVCNYEIDPNTERCTLKLVDIFKIRYYSNWHSKRILLATIVIVPLVFYYCVLQNYRKARSTIATFRVAEPEEYFRSVESVSERKKQKYSNRIVINDTAMLPIETTTVKYQKF